jgi:hypothetical protein
MAVWRSPEPEVVSRCSPSRPCLGPFPAGTVRRWTWIVNVSETYLPVVTGVAVIGDHVLRLLFTDGTVGDVDFSAEHWTGVLEPLNDAAYFGPCPSSFSQVRGTVVAEPQTDNLPETMTCSTDGCGVVPYYGPAVVTLPELAICAAVLAIGALMTWTLTRPNAIAQPRPNEAT